MELAGIRRPVGPFYRVRFGSRKRLRDWVTRVRVFSQTLHGLEEAEVEPRPVVFAPLIPKDDGDACAYVSDGARWLVISLGIVAELDGATLRTRDLPDGLSLVYGDGVDAEAYERRRAVSEDLS